MIGGELAAEAVPGRHHVVAEARDLGWVADWLYGDGALPPMPLPPRETRPRRAPVHAEAPLYPDAPPPRPTPARRRARGRRARQLALL